MILLMSYETVVVDYHKQDVLSSVIYYILKEIQQKEEEEQEHQEQEHLYCSSNVYITYKSKYLFFDFGTRENNFLKMLAYLSPL